jgi:hypothetical protein
MLKNYGTTPTPPFRQQKSIAQSQFYFPSLFFFHLPSHSDTYVGWLNLRNVVETEFVFNFPILPWTSGTQGESLINGFFRIFLTGLSDGVWWLHSHRTSPHARTPRGRHLACRLGWLCKPTMRFTHED